ncbi:MAG: CRTAC1 family protein [Bryobacterales bacterium]|nr:CRTAC1 family protein [Bryobacterales bacterium]
MISRRTGWASAASLSLSIPLVLWAADMRTLSGRPFTAWFVDVAKTADLVDPQICGNEDTKRDIHEIPGTGVAFLDFDNDGLLDIFLVNGARLKAADHEPQPTNHLYRNVGHGQFADVTHKAGFDHPGWGVGVCAGDMDNDGFDDLYITYWGPNRFYRNLGGGKFADITRSSNTAGPADEWSTGCTFLDYDRDGLLDLAVVSYGSPQSIGDRGCSWEGIPVACGPGSGRSGLVTLYHNQGGGMFEDVSAKAGVRGDYRCFALTAVAADLTRDDWTDIYVACDGKPSLLFRNNRNGTFSEIGVSAGVALNQHGYEQAGMGVAVGDYNQDGFLDLIKTNFEDDLINMYRNIEREFFMDEAATVGLAGNSRYVAWGIGLPDLDNDGHPDLFQVNGHTYVEADKLKRSRGYKNPRVVFRNLGRGTFEDVSAVAGPAIAERHSSRGAAFGDFDNDGDIDILVMNMGEPPSLLRNDLPHANHWVSLLLEGTRSNRGAIGATVMLTAGSLRQTSAVLSQSSFLSQNDRRLHFGLGAATRFDRVIVHWPSGAVEEFPGGPANQVFRLVEGSAKTASVN